MPASGRLLLETNIVIALPKGADTVLSDQAPEVFLPAGSTSYSSGAAKSGAHLRIQRRWGDLRAADPSSRAISMSLVNTDA